MKFSIQRDHFLQGLQFVMGVVERRQNVPILANIFLQLSGNNLTLVGTDHEIELKYHVKVSQTEAFEDGAITLSGRKLVDICRQFSAVDCMKLTLNGSKMILEVGKSRFTLATLPADDFPLMRLPEEKMVREIDRAVIQQLFSSVCFAIAEQDVRYYMNGMYFSLTPETITTVATDGHRLTLCHLKLEDAFDATADFLLPRKGVNELLRILNADNEQKLKLRCAPNAIQIETEKFSFFSRLIDANFPNYIRVIPKDADKIALIDKDLLKQVLQRMLIFTTEKYYAARLFFKKDYLSFYSHNTENEEAVDEIEIKYDGEEMEIAFNIHYLIDALNVLPAGNIAVHFSTPDKSVMINSPQLTCVNNIIMPMSL